MGCIVNKYDFVDKSMSLEELSTQAHSTKNTFERMQIYDYLLVYGTGNFRWEINRFLSNFYADESRDWTGTREMDLLTTAINQDKYLEVKKHCLDILFKHFINSHYVSGRLDSAIYYMDSLRAVYPEHVFFLQSEYDTFVIAAKEIRAILSYKDISEPERLWRLGREYWRVAFPSWRNWAGYTRISFEYFSKLINQYPNSPYVANAKFVMLGYHHEMTFESIGDPSHGLVLAKDYEALLRKHPNTTIRDELLLRITLTYLDIANWKIDAQPDSAAIYFKKADNLYRLIKFQYFQTGQVVQKDWQYRVDYAHKHIDEFHSMFKD